LGRWVIGYVDKNKTYYFKWQNIPKKIEKNHGNIQNDVMLAIYSYIDLLYEKKIIKK
jgi:hypothetical protein